MRGALSTRGVPWRWPGRLGGCALYWGRGALWADLAPALRRQPLGTEPDQAGHLA